jgi:hypothetical protein
MTDETREETQEEEQDVESHGAIGDKHDEHETDGDEDVEAHILPIGMPSIGEPPTN